MCRKRHKNHTDVHEKYRVNGAVLDLVDEVAPEGEIPGLTQRQVARYNSLPKVTEISPSFPKAL